MGARGPKSTSELTVLSFEKKLKRPDPPADLVDEAAVEWRAITDRLPASYFPRESHGLLAQYCRHIVAARRCAQIIAALEKDSSEFNAADYYKALKAQDIESRAISLLAGRMRLAQVSRIPHKQARQPGDEKRPWD